MGSLQVVGTGIRSGLQLTTEARSAIANADIVFYLTSETVTAGLIEGINPSAESLATLYGISKERNTTYAEMVEMILAPVRQGLRVCAAIYGHPGVLSTPGHSAVLQARAEGYEAKMLPGVSSEDCLYADLGLDPGSDGCHSYVAEDFLLRPRPVDVHTPLILKQIAAIGIRNTPTEVGRRGLDVLCATLAADYGPDHHVVVYVAAMFPVGAPTVLSVAIGELAASEIPPLATLYVPPLSAPAVDQAMLERLGLTEDARGSDSVSATAPA